MLNRFPAIVASAVIGQTEADGNEMVVAFVVHDPTSPRDAAALEHHLRESLAPYKRPARIVRIDELPINANGKVVKLRLRALL